MRSLIVTAFVSVDGVMEGPGGEPGYRNSGWTFQDGSGKRLFSGADKDAAKLAIVEHEVYGNGVQKQVFDVVR